MSRRKNSCAKGKVGEREAARLLTSLGLGPARRGKQYSGEEGRDVVHSIQGLHLEVKRCEQLNLYDAVEQAREDAHTDTYVHAMLHRKNRREWLFVVPASEVVGFARCVVAAHELYRQE